MILCVERNGRASRGCQSQGSGDVSRRKGFSWGLRDWEISREVRVRGQECSTPRGSMCRCSDVREILGYLKIQRSSRHCSWSKISKLDIRYSGAMRSVQTHSTGPEQMPSITNKGKQKQVKWSQATRLNFKTKWKTPCECWGRWTAHHGEGFTTVDIGRLAVIDNVAGNGWERFEAPFIQEWASAGWHGWWWWTREKYCFEEKWGWACIKHDFPFGGN